MRSREIILAEANGKASAGIQELILEVLLDIRDKDSVTNINAPYIAKQVIEEPKVAKNVKKNPKKETDSN